MRGPEDLDVSFVAGEAAKRGILIEPVDHYYATSKAPKNCFRMGVTSIPHDRIREGVLQLRDMFHDLTENKTETFASARGEHLTGEALPTALVGNTMISIIAYGDPCTIEICEDGSLVGRAGYAGEDYAGDFLIEAALGFVRENADRPFFLYLAYNAVHSPLQGADAYMQRFADIKDIHRRIFAAMLANMDDSVGEVMNQLRKSGLEDNTIVFFLSDNGGPTRELTSSNLPLRGTRLGRGPYRFISDRGRVWADSGTS